MSDREDLIEAVSFFRKYLEGRADMEIITLKTPAPGSYGECSVRELRRVIAAAESTLPKTKMVEVWHVEYALHSRCPAIYLFNEKETADKQAVFMQKHAAEHGWHCIRVTGPHMQEVPA